MRIAFFSDFVLDEVNGVSHSIVTMMQALALRGHEVCAVVPFASMQNKHFVSKHIIPLKNIRVPWAPMFRICSPFGVPVDLKAFQPDIIHTHTFGMVGFRSLYCARQLQCPIIGTEHTLPAAYAHYIHLDYRFVRKQMKQFAARFYERCDSVITPSSIVAKELQASGMQKHITVLPNAIDVALFHNLHRKKELKEKYHIGDNAVLSFGRLEREKNLENLLRAFALFHTKEKNIELVIIGDGKQKNELQQLAKTLQIADATRFLGLLTGDHLVEVINACDVYAITSESETQSLTTMQAMSCGLPVVAVRSGALPEFVIHGETGFIVTCGDTKEMADRLSECIGNTTINNTFGANSEACAAHYTPTIIATSLERIYTETLRSFKR